MDRLGRPLPPCIAMERGESLPDWSKRAKPDVFHSVAVLANVATRLRDMHDAGYVHRDIKPENVMFLPRENRWTVIDFGCAAHAWKTAPLAYTLVYSPPEVAEAVDAGARTIGVTPAMDAWALGVVAFELLTGQSAFNLVIEGRDSVRLPPRHAVAHLTQPPRQYTYSAVKLFSNSHGHLVQIKCLRTTAGTVTRAGGCQVARQGGACLGG